MKRNEILEELKSRNIIKKDNSINANVWKMFKSDGELYKQIIQLTPFILEEEKHSIKKRLFCILNDIYTLPKCIICDNKVIFNNRGDQLLQFCSKKCRYLYTKKKASETMFERYGVLWAAQNKDIFNKTKKTKFEKYGDENFTNIKKRKETNLKKYSVTTNILTNEFKEKTLKSNLEKYGVTHTSKLKQNRLKAKQTNFKNNGYENFNNRKKANNTKLERYGNENFTNFEQTKRTKLERYGNEYFTNFEKIKQTTLKNFGVPYQAQKHIPKSILDKLNNKYWCYNQHIIQKKSLTKISNDLGINCTTISRYFKLHNIEIKYYNDTIPQTNIIIFLKEHYKGEIQTNNRKLIHPNELDIVIPELKLAIEYCGLYWHSTANQFDKNYHLKKLELCNQKGYRLITIFEDEWLYRHDQVKQKLLSLIGEDKRQRIFARQCDVEKIPVSIKNNFLEEFHIQGKGPGSINIGLFYKNNLVAVISFIEQKNQYILNRYATSCHVVGGFSKLLKYFERNYPKKTIISFADRRWSDGNLYEQTGFKLERILKPDYKYIKGNKRIHKFLFRHKFLKDKLKIYDPNLSELENTKMNNIYRIYDCGLLKYRKE